MRFIKAIFIVVLFLTYIFLPESNRYGYKEGSPLLNHFTFCFVHVSAIHLLLNCYSLWYVINQKVIRTLFLIPTLYLISLVCSFFSESEYPTLGCSGILFAMIGLSCAESSRFWMFISFNLIILMIGFLFPYMNASLHFYCWLCGFLIGAFIKMYKLYQYDCR